MHNDVKLFNIYHLTPLMGIIISLNPSSFQQPSNSLPWKNLFVKKDILLNHQRGNKIWLKKVCRKTLSFTLLIQFWRESTFWSGWSSTVEPFWTTISCSQVILRHGETIETGDTAIRGLWHFWHCDTFTIIVSNLGFLS